MSRDASSPVVQPAAGDPQVLTEKGRRIVKRGGADGFSDDDMLVLEISKRAPGMPVRDIEAFFVALRLEYGEDALHAIRNGHVKFERRSPSGQG
jgi:hypothetical protein